MNTKFEKRTLRKVLSTKRSVDTTTRVGPLEDRCSTVYSYYLFHAWGVLKEGSFVHADIGTKGLINLTRYSIDSHPERSAAGGDPV
jgi:hypothetical protein